MGISAGADFRHEAALESERILRERRLVNVLDSTTSLCLPVEGNVTGALYRIAIIPWLFIILALGILLFGLVLLVLIFTPLVDARVWSIGLAIVAIALGLVLIVMSASAGDGVFEGVMESRLGNRLIDLQKRVEERHPFCIEDPATYQKQKVISEDYATGGVDRRKPGLLLEGLRYRYVIRPTDVTALREDGYYRLITYSVGRASVTLAINVSIGDDEKERQVLEEIKATLDAEAP